MSAQKQNHPRERITRSFHETMPPRYYGWMAYSVSDAFQIALDVSAKVRARTAPKAAPAWEVANVI